MVPIIMTRKTITRVQTGVRIEKTLLKVMKAIAAEKEIGLGDLLEGVMLHAFEGRQAFSRSTREQIAVFKDLYGLELTAEDSHRMKERRREN